MHGCPQALLVKGRKNLANTPNREVSVADVFERVCLGVHVHTTKSESAGRTGPDHPAPTETAEDTEKPTRRARLAKPKG